MTIYYWTNFSKRKNSTKQPATSGTSVDVYLKDNCSVESPVFVISGINLAVNYVKWDDHYYFVDDIVLVTADIYELRCSMDVLATFKSEIGSYNAFIERAASAYDTDLNDDILSSQQDETNVHAVATSIAEASPGTMALDTTGCYLLNTFGLGGVHLYGYNSLAAMAGILNNSSYPFSAGSWQQLIDTIGLNLLDVSAYVSNVRWIPFQLSDIAGNDNQNVEVSFWSLNNVKAKEITAREITIRGTVGQPTNAYNDFRAKSPRFSRYAIYLPGVGTVGLNPIDIYGNNLYYTMCFDLFTGEVMYMLYIQTLDSAHRAFIGSYCGKLACEIPYATTSRDAFGVIDTLIGGASSGSSMASGNAAAGAAGIGITLGQAELKAVETYCQPQHSINGTVGNMSKIKEWPNIVLSVTNYGSKDFPLSVAGRPLCEFRQISTLSGFIRCGAPSVEIPGMGGEKEAVNGYLASGFYYE